MMPPRIYQRQTQLLPRPLDIALRGNTGPPNPATPAPALSGPDTPAARALSRLPLRRIQAALRAFRAYWFRAPQPEGVYLQAYAPLGDVRRALGKQSWAPNWEYSYYKKGEGLNLARVVYSEEDGDVVWWQTHCRGWGSGDGRSYLRAHWEAEPTEYPVEHLLETGLSVERGMDNLRSALDDAGIGYDRVRRTPGGGWTAPK